MRTRMCVVIAAAMALAIVAAGGCGHEQKQTTSPAGGSASSSSKAGAPGAADAGTPIYNSRCPVAGDPVDPGVETVNYDGKRWGFCCDTCVPDFKKDPAKYAAKYEKDHPDKK